MKDFDIRDFDSWMRLNYPSLYSVFKNGKQKVAFDLDTYINITTKYANDLVDEVSTPEIDEEEKIIDRIEYYSNKIRLHDLWLRHCSSDYVSNPSQWMTEEQFEAAFKELKNK